MAINIGKNIAGIVVPIVTILLLVGLFLLLRGYYFKTQAEKEKAEEFEKKGLFRSIHDFFMGESEGERTEYDKQVDAEKQQAEKVSSPNRDIEQISTRDIAHALDYHQRQIEQLSEQQKQQNRMMAEQLKIMTNTAKGIDSSKQTKEKMRMRTKTFVEANPQALYSRLKAMDKDTRAKFLAERFQKRRQQENALKGIVAPVNLKPSSPVTQITPKQIQKQTPKQTPKQTQITVGTKDKPKTVTISQKGTQILAKASAYKKR